MLPHQIIGSDSYCSNTLTQCRRWKNEIQQDNIRRETKGTQKGTHGFRPRPALVLSAGFENTHCVRGARLKSVGKRLRIAERERVH